MPPVTSKPKSLGQVAKQAAPKKKRTEPLWRGPEDAGPLGGITQSMCNDFLFCRERFRLKYVEGLQPADDFNHRLEYGSMFHAAEEAHAGGKDWVEAVAKHTQKLAQRYPHCTDQIRHWYQIVKKQFPLYVEHWAKHPDNVKRQPIFQEKTFHIPYRLPGGRVVYLRGKWDSVDLVGSVDAGRIWLVENKTKGDIKAEAIQRQLRFDAQTMIYIIALEEYWRTQVNVKNSDFWRECNGAWSPKIAKRSIAGVRYCVVRRPLSGGKGTIVRHKPSKSNPQGETEEAFYNRVAEYIRSEPEHFFMRWNVDIVQRDVESFKLRFLHPLLLELCKWYDFVTTGDPWRPINLRDEEKGSPGIHFQFPFGGYNPISETGSSDMDELVMSGCEVGFRRVQSLFPELEEA